MKKSLSILAVAAVAGFSALTATPANAVVGAAFANCTEAAAAGQYNIPATSPDYAPRLDSDHDGVGCEKAGEGTTVAQAPAQSQTQVQAQAPAQVAKKPVGAAPTGVEQKGDNGMGLLALGGLVSTAAVGAAVVRRRIIGQA